MPKQIHLDFSEAITQFYILTWKDSLLSLDFLMFMVKLLLIIDIISIDL